MSKLKYQYSKNLSLKMRTVLILSGIIPLYLVIYLFFVGEIDLTNKITRYTVLILFLILIGFFLIRKFVGRFINLSKIMHVIITREKNKSIWIKTDKEMDDIDSHFYIIVKEFKEADRNTREQTVQLAIYARDLSLSYQKAKEEEILRYKYTRYVGENQVEKLMNSKDDLFPQNERREVTVLSADIKSFTAVAENMSAEDIVSMLNEYFSKMVKIIFENNGILEKIIGDQLMAVFGLITSGGSAPDDAIVSAMEMQQATEDLMIIRESQGKELFKIGVAINTGNAVVGNVGPENRQDYTVIGDTVYVAAGLQKITKGGEILIGEHTYRQTQLCFHIQNSDKIYVKNRNEPVKYYSILK
jgi:class 3 adenylate cyclase